MRIDALELRKYGPFTGRVLDLSRGAHGLHVVHGPNEAGKSSALRGLTAALFGIARETTDDFVHAYPELRLGLTLRSAAGERLSCVRRKANRNPLRDAADDAALPDDALRPFLGRVEAEEFERVFGLDHVRLRQGSERLLAATAAADSAMVGATLGVDDLRRVRAALDEEARALFTPRASKPRINAALGEWKRLQAGLRQRELGRAEYRAARDEAAAQAEARDRCTARVAELQQQQRALELARRNLPRVAELAELRAQLAAAAGIPDLADDFVQRRRDAETMLVKAQVLRDQLQKELAVLSAEPQQEPSAARLLTQLDAVEELRALASQVQKATSDRERRLAEARSEAQERDRLARELGVAAPSDRAALDALRAGLSARGRCEVLVQQYAGLTGELAGLEQARAELATKKAACDLRCAAAKPAVDHALLKQGVRAAHQLGDVDGEIGSAAAGLAEVDRALAEGLRQLPGFVGTVATLAEGPVPGAASIEAFARRYRELDEEARSCRARQQELQQRRDRLAADVARTIAGGTVPSEQELAVSRRRRQSQWQLVRRAWLERAEVEAEARGLDPERPLAEAFAHSLERSDQLADQMRRESDRVAQLEEKHRQLQDLDRELAGSAAKAGAEAVERARLDAEWAAAWAASGLSVRDVAAMQDVLGVRQRLLDLAARRRALVADRDDGRRRREAARVALTEALRAAGVAAGAASADGALAPLLAQAEAHLEELEKAAAARQRDVDDQRRFGEELVRAERRLAGLAQQLAAWRTAFAAATQGLPGRPDDAPAAVLGVLHRLASIVEKSERVDELQQRIRRIDADAVELGRRVAEFRRAHLPELGEEEPVAFVARLTHLVDAAKADRARLDAKAKDRERLLADLRRADLEHRTATGILQALAQEAGAGATDALPQLVQRAVEKRGWRERAAQLEGDLRREGLPLDELERRVAAGAGRDLEGELPGLARAGAAAQQEADQLRDAVAAANARVAALEQQAGAAETAEEMAGIATGVRGDVERYVRSAAASHLLGAAVRHFRSKHETPLLRHATGYFGGLTCGRYDRIDTDADPSGRPFFQVREAAAGTVKPLAALSDGTRDQLHLALVLGSLAHRFAAGGEPMPLVLDDVLVHFDDARSLAALSVLAGFAAVTQVILFTHHARIREQAATLVGGGQVFLHDL